MKESRKNIHKELRDLFVPYELAWQLQNYNSKKEEEAGKMLFNKECIAFWNHYQEIHMNHTYDEYAQHLKAPFYQQVIDWFREMHKIDITPKSHRGWSKKIAYFSMVLKHSEERGCELLIDDSNRYSYYKAINKSIEQALKFIC